MTDQYYTCPSVVAHCISVMKSLVPFDLPLLEPSAGTGAFSNQLDCLAMDIDPKGKDIIKQDFLSWKPDRKYICLGNPPFGFRGALALRFLNKALEFCPSVGFILPCSFNSKGQGTCRRRTKGKLIHNEYLPRDIFIHNGKPRNLQTVFQVWVQGENIIPEVHVPGVEIYTVCTIPARKCGEEHIKRARFFLTDSYWGEAPKVERDFSKLKYRLGYAIYVPEHLEERLLQVDWSLHAKPGTSGVMHLVKQDIMDALAPRGHIE